ncbi:MAG: amidase [Ruminococcaceae bacterium]|nr:amidase [Oscillospiraceae bacterium]
MLVYKEYNRARAVEYARRWALSRNPLFTNFAGRGGDCTSFVSQCIYAGSCQMNFTPDFGWYYINENDRAPAWSSVEYFYDFMTGRRDFMQMNGGIGPYGIEVDSTGAIEGDVVQLADETGDFYHTLIISGFSEGQTLVCAHTNDALDKPLSTYNFSSLRYIHIEGVRLEVMDDNCFSDLLEGISLSIRDEINQ